MLARRYGLNPSCSSLYTLFCISLSGCLTEKSEIILSLSFTVWVFVFPVDFFFLTLLPLRVAPVLTALPLLLAAALLEGKLSHAARAERDLADRDRQAHARGRHVDRLRL